MGKDRGFLWGVSPQTPQPTPQDLNKGHPLLEAGAQETQPKAHLSPLQPTSCPHPVPYTLGNQSNPGIQVADASLPCPMAACPARYRDTPQPTLLQVQSPDLLKMSQKGPGRPGWG